MMAQSGWYDDPDGTPGRLRYWDGTQWTPDTMPRPSAAPSPMASAPTSPQHTEVLPPVAGPAAPVYTPAQPYGGAPYPPAAAPGAPYSTGQAYGGAHPYPPGPGPVPVPPKKRRLNPLLALGALVLVVGLAVLVNGALRDNAIPNLPGATPTTTNSKPAGSTAPSTFPTVTNPPVTVPGVTVAPTMPEPSDGTLPTPADCPQAASGQLTDGTISVTVPSTWKLQKVSTISWATCFAGAGRALTDSWQTGAIVASVPADGATAEEVAKGVWDWNLGSNYEPASITGHKVATAAATKVGARSGFKVTGQVLVKGMPGIAGDDVTIIVLVNADGSHSVLLATATIKDAQSADEVAAVLSSLKVG